MIFLFISISKYFDCTITVIFLFLKDIKYKVCGPTAAGDVDIFVFVRNGVMIAKLPRTLMQTKKDASRKMFISLRFMFKSCYEGVE
jgi:hypothetical protein